MSPFLSSPSPTLHVMSILMHFDFKTYNFCPKTEHFKCAGIILVRVKEIKVLETMLHIPLLAS